MSDSHPTLSPEVLALLERERVIPSLPAQVRARSLTRARAVLVAGRVTPPAGFDAPGRGGHSSLAKLTAACVASAAIGATAYQLSNRGHTVASDRPTAPVVRVFAAPPSPSMPLPTVSVVPSPQTPAPTLAVTPSLAPARVIPPPHASNGASGADGLRLLRQARAAVAKQEFATALSRIAEHTHRFKDSRMAEEREALRVRALSGLGRSEEARHASEAFQVRFPRSVLLPAVRQMTGSGP
jgi:hypothetical protein